MVSVAMSRILHVSFLFRGQRLGLVNSLRPRQNGRHFADNIFKCIFSNENVRISIQISRQFVPRGQIYSNPTLVQIMNLWWLVYWRIYASLGLSELTDFFHSVISSFVRNHQNTRCYRISRSYLTGIFHSPGVVAPVKYEYDSKNLTGDFSGTNIFRN